MKSMFKRYAAGGLAMLLAISGAGCGKKNENAADSEEAAKYASAEYPLDTDVVLKYWFGVGELKSGGVFADTLAKQTGIKIEVMNAANDISQKKQQFSLLLASDDKPDIMEYQWGDPQYVAGGPDDAIKSNYIIPLNDLLDTASPNLKKYLSEHPDIDKEVKTTNGQYYIYPFLRAYDENRIFQGPMMRKDWLDELGLEIPETMDEWYNVLKAFKEKKGATAPLTFIVDGILPHSLFIGAYGAGFNFYVEDGKVKYGQAQPAYKDFLTEMNKWYEEGLLDNNITTLDATTFDAKMTNGTSGAANAGVGGGLGKWLGLMKDANPSYDLVAVPYPSLHKGEKAMFNGITGIYGGSGAAISADSKHPVLAAKLLDYFYGEEGNKLAAFGTEGVTYEMKDGKPTYTDYVMKNPDGFSMDEILKRETRATFGPCVQSPRYFEQYASLPQQQAAIKTWANSGESDHIMPFVLRTDEEEKEFSKIYSDINTFTRESMMGFICGQKPLSEFDAYIATLKDMKIDRAVEIMQKAYDRYLAK